jgi:hypothetical protein
MKNLTYRRYLDDPTAREQLEREARRERAQMVYRCLVMPLMGLFSRRPAKTARVAAQAA